VLGQKVKTLVNRQLEAGTHTAVWNATDENGHSVSSGVYFYRLRAGNFSETKKMMILK
jgi:methionine-rich copper-binding protein CopC